MPEWWIYTLSRYLSKMTSHPRKWLSAMRRLYSKRQWKRQNPSLLISSGYVYGYEIILSNKKIDTRSICRSVWIS